MLPVKAIRHSLALLGLCLLSAAGFAEEMIDSSANCLDCHRASADAPVHAILNTAHGQLGAGGNDSCTSCHGGSTAHRANPAKSPDISFGPHWQSEATQRDGSCLNCHEEEGQLLWAGSTHQSEGLSCTSCHSSHQQSRLLALEEKQQDQCLDCHNELRGQLRLPSRHPIAEGKTDCVDCHTPHGSSTDADLHQVSLNDNCFSCHQEKRGPFLFEHPPVSEDCSLCHRPHGSPHPDLLTARGPGQCQQCHAAAFHPSLPYGGEGIASGAPNQNLLGKNCMNCHSQVHGSNHPSGARLTR